MWCAAVLFLSSAVTPSWHPDQFSCVVAIAPSSICWSRTYLYMYTCAVYDMDIIKPYIYQHTLSFMTTFSSQSATTPTNNQSGCTCLFVGNLSYFCEEKHLHDLFDQYGHVQQVKIVMNDLNTRSLMFGFVTMATATEAFEMERLMNGMMFMGRKLK